MAAKLKKKNRKNRKDNVVQFKPQFKEGYSVVVKEGTSDPDNEECDIGGWQGRIIHIEDEGDGPSLIRIEWDSITLKNIPHVFIENREKADRLWSEIDLYDNELLPARPRDRKKHVITARKKISKKYRSDLVLDGDDDDTEIDRIEKSAPPKGTLSLLATVTEEYFQPARLYYDLFDKAELQRIFSRLRCMDYDRIQDRWVWLYCHEAKKLKFQRSYSNIPKHLRPIVIGSCFQKESGEMYLDVNSYDRAIKAILFFDKHIPRSVAMVTDIAVVNKLFRHNPDGPPRHNDFFRADSLEIKDPDKQMEELAELTSSAANPEEKLRIALSHSENNAKKRLPEVERFPTHFYEDGITGLEGSLKSRAIIAHRHFIGDTDYSFYDLMQEFVPKVLD